MKRADPATTRKALEFANEMAKCGVPFVVIPFISEQQKERLTVELGQALQDFESTYANESRYRATDAEREIDSLNLD